MIQQFAPVLRGGCRVEGSDVLGLLQEMIDRLVADFDFKHVKMAGGAPINRTTEPVVCFLLWLEKTPEAQDALRSAFRRLVVG